MTLSKMLNGTLVALTDSELSKVDTNKVLWLEGLSESMRQQRDSLLTSSDWTQVADAPVDQAAWSSYRQALRDIPQQAGFPDNITWPQEPSA